MYIQLPIQQYIIDGVSLLISENIGGFFIEPKLRQFQYFRPIVCTFILLVFQKTKIQFSEDISEYNENISFADMNLSRPLLKVCCSFSLLSYCFVDLNDSKSR